MVNNDHKFFGGEGLHRIYPIVLINGKEFDDLSYLFAFIFCGNVYTNGVLITELTAE